jgi:parvulin-like peptidyl-prolyl isomerase
VNRSTIQTLTLVGALAATGLVSAQTSKPATPKTSQNSSTPSDAAAKPAGPVDSAIAAPPDPNKVVLDIAGDKMTAGQFDEMVKSLSPQAQQMANGPQRHDFVESLIKLRLAAKEADRLGLQNKPAVKQQLEIQRDQVLMGALYQDLLANIKISDADIQKYYDEHKGDYDSVKAEHILIRFKGSAVPLGKGKKELTDEEALAKAKEVQKRLLAGEDFAKVEKEETDDTSGPLPAFTRGQMVPEFDKAAFSLPIGKVSDPVRTVFGYHIIKVISRDQKTMEQAKTEIVAKLRPELAKKEIEDLRGKGSVTMDEAFFKAPASGAPPAPASR